MLSLLLLFYIPNETHSFSFFIPSSIRNLHYINKNYFSKTKITSNLLQRRISTSSDSDLNQEDKTFHESPTNTPNIEKSTRFEFWLDLRDIAITPYAALDYLYKECEKEWKLMSNDDISISVFPHLMDRILISSSSRSNTRTVSTDEDVDPVLLKHLKSLDMLYFDESQTNLLSHNSDTNVVPVGKRFPISLDPKVMIDPIPAMEYLSHDQKSPAWVVMDYPSKSSISETTSCKSVESRLQHISDLVHFLSMTMPSAKQMNTKGIAILCKTNLELMQSASYLQQFQSFDSISKTSDSGIVFIPTQGHTHDTQNYDETIQAAIVLPFDMTLWKTVIHMFYDESYD